MANIVKELCLIASVGVVVFTTETYLLSRHETQTVAQKVVVPPAPPVYQLKLMVSPAFTDQQEEKIWLAVWKWEKAAGIAIYVEIGACPVDPHIVDACLLPTEHIIDCSPASKNALGCVMPVGYYSMVGIDTEYPNLLSHIIQHELGHILGINDSDTPGTVMYRWVDDPPTYSQDVTQIDVLYCKEAQRRPE